MEREAGHLAHPVSERFVGIARGQGLQGKHLLRKEVASDPKVSPSGKADIVQAPESNTVSVLLDRRPIQPENLAQSQIN